MGAPRSWLSGFGARSQAWTRSGTENSSESRDKFRAGSSRARARPVSSRRPYRSEADLGVRALLGRLRPRVTLRLSLRLRSHDIVGQRHVACHPANFSPGRAFSQAIRYKLLCEESATHYDPRPATQFCTVLRGRPRISAISGTLFPRRLNHSANAFGSTSESAISSLCLATYSITAGH